MTSPDEEGPSSTLPRRQLGRFLRDRREAAGFTIAEAAKLVDLSRAVLQRLETGQIQKVRKQDAQALCEVYGVDATDTKAAVDLAVQAKAKSWYHAYGGLYSGAFNMYVGLEAAEPVEAGLRVGRRIENAEGADPVVGAPAAPPRTAW